MKKDKKELYSLGIAIIGIGLACFFILFANNNVYASGSLLSGTISADKTTVDVGEPIMITVSGDNADSLISLGQAPI